MAIDMEDPLSGLDAATTLRVLPEMIKSQEETTVRTSLSLLALRENPDASQEEKEASEKICRAQRYHLEWLKGKLDRMQVAVNNA